MIKGRKAIVTGGSRGIGAAIVRKLASEGADVAVIYAGNKEKAEALCAECSKKYSVKAISFKCDVADFAQTKETVDKVKAEFGTVDILVNNAGITRDKLIMRMKEEDFDAVINTNLKGAFNMIHHCSMLFLRNKEGSSIVNISSVVGLHGNAGQSNYAASKAGIIGLTKSVAKELSSRNVRCNAVAPGFIDTDMTRQVGDTGAWIDSIPLKRAGSPEEVADAVAFLADAPYITGQVLAVDGGMSM